jgi:AcrR family transcriptional regulator
MNMKLRTRVDSDAVALPRVGRPARINVHAVIAAAIEIGLERLTLKKVADRLGVAVASLYRHVNSSEELVSLAAIQVALRRRLPECTAVHWSELATRYAEILYESFVAEPQLIAELAKGNIGPDLEIEFLDQFLAALHLQGFNATDGVMLHRAVGMLAIGAAVGVAATNASSHSKVTRGDAARDSGARRSRATVRPKRVAGRARSET